MKSKKLIILAGAILGIAAVLLVQFGNPGNMGFCIACFLRDIAGSVGLHQAAVVQYARPEIVGLILGGMIMALAGKEFKSRGGSSPFTRFILGFVVMVGALMFLGCPLRMMLRIGGGDLNAIVGLIGFIGGILLGIVFLNRGFTLQRTYKLHKMEGFLFPGVMVALLVILIAIPTLLIFSTEGPGAMHAPILLSLVAGLVVGALAQKSRLCTMGAVRDVFLFKDYYLLTGFVTIIVVAIIGNLITGTFSLGFADQPVAHTDGLWNFLGMALVGFASALLGGCPLRQLILSAEGNIDSVITTVGMIVGAAICHNFGLASSAKGATLNGQIAVIIGFIVVFIIAFTNLQKKKKERAANE